MCAYSELLLPLDQLGELPTGVRDLWRGGFRVHRHDGC